MSKKTDTPIKRKGATRLADIPPDIVVQLNKGQIETANLMEWLAIDPVQLLKNVFKKTENEKYVSGAIKKIEGLKKPSTLQRHETIGRYFYEESQQQNNHSLLPFLLNHPSDAVRCWACYYIGAMKGSVAQILKAIEPLAADPHFGVREVAWFAVRPVVANDLEKGISLLAKWSQHKDENLRRFASECTRPRGVWCRHIDILKENPEKALDILEPLKADPSKYVRDSVGNWLNDAAKSKPEWVKTVCKRWEKESPGKDTQYIIKKALRSL